MTREPRSIPPAFILIATSVVVLSAGCSAQISTNEPELDYYDSRDHHASEEQRGDAGGGESSSAERASTSDREPSSVLVRRAPESNGPLDGDEAGRALFEAADQLAACYDETGAERSGAGVAFVIFDVERGGEITKAVVGHSDVRDTRFVDCLERTLRSIAMPESEGKSVIQAYLVFGAEDEEEGRRMLSVYREARARSADRWADALPLTQVRTVVQGCYERAFRGRTATQGRLVLGMTMGQGGLIDRVEITEDNFDGRLDECVHAALRGLRLQLDAEDSSTISYPVLLQPGERISSQEDTI
jgi:hypothetical protein